MKMVEKHKEPRQAKAARAFSLIASGFAQLWGLGLRFGVWGLGFRVWGLGLGFTVWGSGFRVSVYITLELVVWVLLVCWLGWPFEASDKCSQTKVFLSPATGKLWRSHSFGV